MITNSNTSDEELLRLIEPKTEVERVLHSRLEVMVAAFEQLLKEYEELEEDHERDMRDADDRHYNEVKDLNKCIEELEDKVFQLERELDSHISP